MLHPFQGLLSYRVAKLRMQVLVFRALLDCHRQRWKIVLATSGIASFLFALTFILSSTATSRQVLLS